MFSITRKVEYALIGLAHIAEMGKGQIVTVRRIAEAYRIPGKLLAKVFHEMKIARILMSHQGKNGGYSLARDPKDVTLTQVIQTIEGSADLVTCIDSDGHHCPQFDECNIKNPMEALNSRLRGFLDSVTLETFCQSQRDKRNNRVL